MNFVALTLAALGIYGLFSRSSRHETPEEWAAIFALDPDTEDYTISDAEIGEYARHLDQHKITGAERAGLIASLQALQQDLLTLYAQGFVDQSNGQPLNVSAMTREDWSASQVSEGDEWGCPPTWVEGSGDYAGSCVPGVPHTSGVISRAQQWGIRQ